MDIKIGDYLLCKEDFYYNGKLTFEKDKYYQINDINRHDNDNVTVQLESTHYKMLFWYKNDMITKDSKYKKWYVWTYFYTPAELRQKQIDSVIDGYI